MEKCLYVELLTNVTADRVICETVKKVRRGSIEYIDKRKDYRSDVCGYRHLNIDHDKKFVNGKVYT